MDTKRWFKADGGAGVGDATVDGKTILEQGLCIDSLADNDCQTIELVRI